MTLRRAQLIPDTIQPCGDGVTGAQVAAVLIDGETHRAYVKMLPAQLCAAEAYCALLLKTWGLSVPEPLWVEHSGNVWFGSLDAEYPSLKQRFQINGEWPQEVKEALIKAAAAVVAAFPSVGLACAADEAINNVNRNLGNILWDGGEPSWIDHERALGLEPGDKNKLAEIALIAEKGSDVQRSAIAAALTMARDVLKGVEEQIPGDVSCFTELVSARLARIGNLVDSRFPAPIHDLFSK